MDLACLPTERHRTELADLDQRPASEIAALMADETATVAAAVRDAAPAIGAAVDAIVARLAGGRGRIVYVGAGTAGRIGLLDAAECGPTFNTDRVVAVLAGGSAAFGDAREAAEDDAEAGRRDIDDLRVGRDDAVVGVAASGRTPYTIGAVEAAGERGALTIGISSNPDAELSRHVDHPIEVVTGPELLAGSTRLKAGTAQKVVLNTISTAVMAKLGKTYGNLMVDVRATNVKLRDRAERIIVVATGSTPGDAAAALQDAGGEVKVAIVALLTGLSSADARERLATSGGVVRDALGEART